MPVANARSAATTEAASVISEVQLLLDNSGKETIACFLGGEHIIGVRASHNVKFDPDVNLATQDKRG
jgi:hypothetical protein